MAAAVAAGIAIGPPALALAVPAAVAAGLGHARAEARARRLHRASRRDTLTGLGNRLLLAERVDYEMLRHGRHERPLAAFALDLDGFKAVNDRYGHAAGDEVLVEVARALHRVLRAQDTARASAATSSASSPPRPTATPPRSSPSACARRSPRRSSGSGRSG